MESFAEVDELNPASKNNKHKDNQKKRRNLLLSSEKRTIRCFCCMKKLIYLSFFVFSLTFSPHLFVPFVFGDCVRD